MGPLVSKSQRDKVFGFIESAKQEGARVVTGGKAPETAATKGGYFCLPTIFADVKPSMRIAREEIFGALWPTTKRSELTTARPGPVRLQVGGRRGDVGDCQRHRLRPHRLNLVERPGDRAARCGAHSDRLRLDRESQLAVARSTCADHFHRTVSGAIIMDA
jgi:hypothetical protein